MGNALGAGGCGGGCGGCSHEGVSVCSCILARKVNVRRRADKIIKEVRGTLGMEITENQHYLNVTIRYRLGIVVVEYEWLIERGDDSQRWRKKERSFRCERGRRMRRAVRTCGRFTAI